MTPAEVLKQYWNFDGFRPLQLDIIQSVLEGHDTLAVMPTGGGKSICFQVPAIMREGICLVITPLIALIKDQTARLKDMGIPVLHIHSGMGFPDISRTLKNAVHGNFKFLYVSPERLQSELFLEYLPAITLNLIAIDEAHCISQWGYDFRPSYLKIEVLRKLKPDTPVLALTASATLGVQKDIVEKLAFRSGFVQFTQSFERKNLSYRVVRPSSKPAKLLEILQQAGGSAIVYCRTRKQTLELHQLLRTSGIPSGYYHAGLSGDARSEIQEGWVRGAIRVMATTNAFGMGIDKPDVRIVVHYDLPDALENYYQEAGRAGRDGKKAYGVLFLEDQQIGALKMRIPVKFPPPEIIRKVYGALVNYLQLPSGSGEELSFDFFLDDFVNKFSLEAPLVASVLHILEQEELLSYHFGRVTPSRVTFLSAREEMIYFEDTHPGCEPVLKALLRMYGGILDGTSPIDEGKISKSISRSKREVEQCLELLHRFGILRYEPRSENPRIRFLQNRVRAADLAINAAHLRQRRKAYEDRMEAMIHYATNTSECRSRMIAHYFNDLTAGDCGICDNCLRKKNGRTI